MPINQQQLVECNWPIFKIFLTTRVLQYFCRKHCILFHCSISYMVFFLSRYIYIAKQEIIKNFLDSHAM